MADTPVRNTFRVTGAGASVINDATNAIFGVDVPGGAASGMTTVESISSLKGLTGMANGETRLVLGYYAANDGAGLPPYRYNSSSSATDNGGTVIAPNTGVGRWEMVHDSTHLSALWFGAKADGTQDDAPKIRAMIAEAEAKNIGLMLFPYGANGIYLCASRLVEARLLKSGLSFVAVGRRGNQSATDAQVSIRYTGTQVCFDIRNDVGSFHEVGAWLWKGFLFRTTQGAAGMFRFNDPAGTMEDPGPHVGSLPNIRFEGCYFWGAYGDVGGANQTGNAIEGLNVFELVTDDSCFFRDWKRAVYGKGFDNCHIGGRAKLNVRAVHLERTGSVGNNSVIDMRAIMGPQNDGVEDSRHIHLDANSTIVYPCGMEHGAKAAIYLNGVADVIYAPSFGNPAPVAPNNVFLRVGPKAQECVIYAPSTTSWPDAGTNVYDAPETWNWRGLNQLYKVVVYSPSKRLEHTVFKPHPRLKVVSEYAPVDEQSRDGELSASGESVSRVFTSAFHLENLTPIFNNDSRGVSGVSADADAYEGYRFELPASNGGALATLKFGRDFKNGHLIRCRARYKLAASPSSGNCSSVVLKNGGSFVASGATGNHTSYQTIDLVTYTVSGFIAGDELGVGFDNGANQAVHVSSILVEVLEPPSVTGSRGANAALASLLTQLASRGIVIDNTTA